MASPTTCVPATIELNPRRVDTPSSQKTSPRNVHSPRPELVSGRRKRDSIEPKESKSFSLASSVGTTLAGKRPISEKTEDLQEGMTLDKYFGSTFQKVEISSISSNRDDVFPQDPASKKRGTVIQENFEIKETDAEDEDCDDSKRDIADEIDDSPKPAEMHAAAELKISKLSDAYSRTNLETKSPEPESFTTKARKTMASFSKKPTKEFSDDEQFRMTRNIREFIEKSPYRKSVVPHSKSPAGLRKTKDQFYVKNKKSEPNCVALETEGNGRNSIENIKPENEMSSTKRGFRQSFGTSFYNKTNTYLNKGTSYDMHMKNLNQNEAEAGRSALRGLDMMEERRAAKENKFTYQNALLTEKILEEEKMLLTKYGTKFGINVDHYHERYAINLAVAKNGNGKSEKPRTPFQISPRQRTFQKSGSGKNLLIKS